MDGKSARNCFSKLIGIVISLAFCSVMVAAQCEPYPQNEPHYSELPNFHQVNEHLYRGAQPHSDGFQKLAHEFHVKTVVDLRSADEHARDEEILVRAEGMNYFNVPMRGRGKPTDEQVESALRYINDPQNWPVFVHCHYGKDRTGTIIAIYRITYNNWTATCAISEAKHYRMSWFEKGMKSYIEDYGKRRLPPQTGTANVHNMR